MADEINAHEVPLSEAPTVRVVNHLFEMECVQREQQMEHLLQQKQKAISDQALARMGKTIDDELTDDEYDTYDYLLLEMSHGV